MKPNTSRPANSERYLVCCDMKHNVNKHNIRQYLREVVGRLWERENSKLDILEIVPLNVLKSNEKFSSFIINCNNWLGTRQYNGLQKLSAFCRNPDLTERRQDNLRKECLKYWKVPDRFKQAHMIYEISDLMTVQEKEIIANQPIPVNTLHDLESAILYINDWHFVCLHCNTCCVYAGLGENKVQRYQNGDWVKVKNVHLVPGTLLLGEFVKERFYPRHDDEEKNDDDDKNNEKWKYSLHVIDAIQLGNVDLRTKNFHERMDLIGQYCKAINHENNLKRVRIRHKKLYPLKEITNKMIKLERDSKSYYCKLPLMGFQTIKERFHVNSILLLKTDNKESFESTYLNKRQIFISPESYDGVNVFNLEDIQNFIKIEMDA